MMDLGLASPGSAPPTVNREDLRACSGDARLLRAIRLRQGQMLRVHSVFEHLINVDAGDDRLFSLAHRDADDAPDTLVVDVGRWSPYRLAAGGAVRLCGEAIELGDGLVLGLAAARPWQCELPSYAQDERVLAANLVVAHDYLERYGKGIGLERSLGDAATPFERALIEAFRAGKDALCRAIAANDEALALRAVALLVGLGPGLTPSGDDFLVGLLAVLNLPHGPCRRWRRIGAAIVDCALVQTNAISRAALRHAAHGRVRASLVRLCSALMHANSTPMVAELDRVLRIGSSSGTDIALGMLSAMQLHLQTERV